MGTVVQKAETLNENLVELSTECMASVDAKGRIVWCNTATTETLGFSKEEIVGKHFSEIGVIAAQEVPRCLLLFRSALKGKLHNPFEITLKHRDGTPLLCEVRVGLIKDGRKVVGCQVVARDITKQKQAEQVLGEFQLKFKTLAEQSPSMIFINRMGSIIYANKKCAEIMGYRREELCSSEFNFISLIAPESKDLIRKKFGKHAKGLEISPYECTLITKEGNRIYTIISTKLMEHEGERSILGTITDISKYKKAEEELRANEERFRDLFENANDLIQSIDANQRFVYVNRKWLETLGYSKEEIKELRLSDIIRKDQIPHCLEVFKRVRTGESADKVETVFVAKDGREVYVEGEVNARIKDGKFITTRSIFRDITEHRLAERRLAESEAKYRSLVENSLEGIGVSKGNQIIFANKALLDILGYDTFDEVAKVPLLDHVAPKSKGIVQKRIKMRKKGKSLPSRYEFSIIRKNGEIKDLAISTNEVIIGDEKYVQSTFRDITERKE